MSRKRQVSYKDGSVTFEQTSFKVHGLDKLQSAIESITDRNDTVLVELNMQDLLNLRRLLVQDMVSNMLSSDDFRTKVELSKASKQKSTNNKRETISQSETPLDHTKSDYENNVLVLKYVLGGVSYADEKEALTHLMENKNMSHEFASRYLSILPHLL